MALINCPECGHEVSKKAKACPSCGYAIEDLDEKYLLRVLANDMDGGVRRRLASNPKTAQLLIN